MIRSYNDLALTREQLARVENILLSLHQEIYAKNPRNYALYAEGPIDMILQLRAEIDAFLHIAPAPTELSSSGDHGTADGVTVGQGAAAEALAAAETTAATS